MQLQNLRMCSAALALCPLLMTACGGGSSAPPTAGPPAIPPPDPPVTPPPDPPPPDPPVGDTTFDADFLWQTIDLASATDMGFAVSEVPAGQQVDGTTLTLTEVGDSAGLSGVIAGGNPHGVGVGFVDVDLDGFEDLIVINGSGFDSYLYMNDGAGRFTDRTTASGIDAILNPVGGSADGYSVAAADYDADGDFDLYVTAMPTDFLLQNDGNGNFTDVTSSAGAGGPSSTQPGSASKIAAWGDYNGDGLMDVVVASSTFDNGSSAYLLRNDGNGTFTDVTAQSSMLISSQGNPCAVMWSDMDADGDQDLWVWNDRGDSTSNRSFMRNNNGSFTDDRALVGATFSVGNPMGIDGADLDHDGHIDYYVSNVANNPLLHNNGDGTFSEISAQAGTQGDFGWGLGFEDFNHDGWWDIFVSQEDVLPYLTFRNLKTSPPTFTRQDWPHNTVASSGHNVAVAFADYNHDGKVDVVTASTSGDRVNLYRNDTDVGTHGWLEVKIPQVPGGTAVGGISARVVVRAGDLVQFKDITGGSSRASQNAMSARFGIGHWNGADWVAVLWPDGRQVSLANVEGNRVLQVPSGP